MSPYILENLVILAHFCLADLGKSPDLKNFLSVYGQFS